METDRRPGRRQGHFHHGKKALPAGDDARFFSQLLQKLCTLSERFCAMVGEGMCVHSWSARLLDWLARAANVGRRIFARILLRLPQGGNTKRTSAPGQVPLCAPRSTAPCRTIWYKAGLKVVFMTRGNYRFN